MSRGKPKCPVDAPPGRSQLERLFESCAISGPWIPIVRIVRIDRANSWGNVLKSHLRWLSKGLRRRGVLIRLTLHRRWKLGQLVLSARSKRPIIGDAPAVVCLTSYGDRIKHVHYTIETIAKGITRPRTIILWISEGDANLITPALRSLERRGLEIRLTEDYGPHKKYYPYCVSTLESAAAQFPLVTADDDVLYPEYWLRDLIDAANAEPFPVIVAHRAHKIRLEQGAIAPYLSWDLEHGTVKPSYANVATGVCGVLYPPEFVAQVGKAWNTEFMQAAPKADDLWLHSRAILLQVPTKQARSMSGRIFEHHPGTPSLMDLNLAGGNNDVTIRRIYSPEMISTIRVAVDPDGLPKLA
jgi:hypothetical protein